MLASSARALRSPLTRFTWAKSSWSFIRSIESVRPFDWLSRYGVSICWMSPVKTTFDPSPARAQLVRQGQDPVVGLALGEGLGDPRGAGSAHLHVEPPAVGPEG